MIHSLSPYYKLWISCSHLCACIYFFSSRGTYCLQARVGMHAFIWVSIWKSNIFWSRWPCGTIWVIVRAQKTSMLLNPLMTYVVISAHFSVDNTGALSSLGVNAPSITAHSSVWIIDLFSVIMCHELVYGHNCILLHRLTTERMKRSSINIHLPECLNCWMLNFGMNIKYIFA